MLDVGSGSNLGKFNVTFRLHGDFSVRFRLVEGQGHI